MSSDGDDAPLIRRVTASTTKASKASKRKRPRDESSEDEPYVKHARPRARPKADAKRKVTPKRKAPQSSDSEVEEPKRKRAAPKRSASSKKAPVTSTRLPKKKNVKDEEDVEEEAPKVKLKFKEGQRFICPPKGDGTRAFYEELLLKDQPNSLMAIRYCIEHGVLLGTQHKEQYQKYRVLKDLGAFRKSTGGIQLRFKDGISEADMQEWTAMHGSTGGLKMVKKATSPRKSVKSDRMKK